MRVPGSSMYMYVYVAVYILQTRVGSIYHNTFVFEICKFHWVYNYIYNIICSRCPALGCFVGSHFYLGGMEIHRAFQRNAHHWTILPKVHFE